MTIVHPPRTDENADTIEALDWAPPCQYRHHLALSPQANAVWAVWLIPGVACVCPGAPDFRYFCQPCWDFRNGPGTTQCRGCGTVAPAMASIKRVERI